MTTGRWRNYRERLCPGQRCVKAEQLQEKMACELTSHPSGDNVTVLRPKVKDSNLILIVFECICCRHFSLSISRAENDKVGEGQPLIRRGRRRASAESLGEL